MGGRKKVWTATTPLRYKQKAYKIAKAQGVPEELAMQVVDGQTIAWTIGAGLYRRIREIAQRVMVREDTYVAPIMRAAYYAFAQRLYKLCVMTGEASPEDVIDEFNRKSVDFRAEVLESIVEALGLSRKEVVAATPAGAT